MQEHMSMDFPCLSNHVSLTSSFLVPDCFEYFAVTQCFRSLIFTYILIYLIFWFHQHISTRCFERNYICSFVYLLYIPRDLIVLFIWSYCLTQI
ncbi:hypothetical protein V1511DRAFT_501795 [Dipodascopsis uninucleata]